MLFLIRETLIVNWGRGNISVFKGGKDKVVEENGNSNDKPAESEAKSPKRTAGKKKV